MNKVNDIKTMKITSESDGISLYAKEFGVQEAVAVLGRAYVYAAIKVLSEEEILNLTTIAIGLYKKADNNDE